MEISTLEGIRATLLLQEIPNGVEEADVIDAVEEYGRTHGTYMNVHELRKMDKHMLVTIQTTENELERLYEGSLIVKGFSISIASILKHREDAVPTIVMDDLPNGTSADSLEVYLEGQQVDIESVVMSDNGQTAYVELKRYSDIPYLLSKTHIMRKKTITITQQHPYQEPIASHYGSSPYSTEPSPLENIYSSLAYSSPLQPEVLIITGVKMNETFIRRQLDSLFSRPPYELQIRTFLLKNEVAYITFTDPEGVSKVIACAPTNVSGIPIACSKGLWSNVPAAPDPIATSLDPAPVPDHVPVPVPRPRSKQLVIDKIPPDMDAAFVRDTLDFLFAAGNHVISDFTMVGSTAYLKFKNTQSIQQIIDNPPDNSELLGAPVEYSVINKSQVQNDDEAITIAVRGLPIGTSPITIGRYLKNVTKVDFESCIVKDGEAYVTYKSSQDGRGILNNPPRGTFFGKQLEYAMVTGMNHQQSDVIVNDQKRERPAYVSSPSLPANYINSSYNPEHPIRRERIEEPEEHLEMNHPKPAPRKHTTSKLLADKIVLKQLPCNVQDWVLTMYIEKLCGIKCKSIKLGKGVAVIEMPHTIDIEELRRGHFRDPFPGCNTYFKIDPLEPSTSVLVSSVPPNIPEYVVRMYCEKFGNVVKVTDLGGGKFIISYENSAGVQKVLDHPAHSFGTNPIVIGPYCPVMAEMEETDSPGLPISPHHHFNVPASPVSPVHKQTLPQQEIYQWPSVRENVSRISKRYYHHALEKLKNELISIHAEGGIREDVLELKPTHEAGYVQNWKVKAQNILSQCKHNFRQVDMHILPPAQQSVKEFLHDHKKQFVGFDFHMQDGTLEMGGSTACVDQALQNISDIVKEDSEISIKIENSPRNIEYLLKFAQAEINKVHPPVNIVRDSKDPTVITAKGNKSSLAEVQKIAHEKLNQAFTENIPLTTKVYRLLSEKEGVARMEQAFEKLLPKLVYGFECVNDEIYTHQIYILSPDQSSCSVAKRKLDDLLKVERIHLSSEKNSIGGTQEWRDFCGQLSSEYFVHISCNEHEVTITGESLRIGEICNKVNHFLNVQDNVTEEVSIKCASWRIIYEHLNSKFNAVTEDARSMKVGITSPGTQYDSTDTDKVIKLQGSIKAVGDIRCRLQFLMNEVLVHPFQVPFQPGIQQVMYKGEVRTKVLDLEHKHKVIIEHDVQEVAPSKLYGRQSTRNILSGNPYRLIRATTPIGINVSVYSGNYSLAPSDVLVTFVPTVPDLQAPVFASIVETGGQEILGELETTLTRRTLLEATVHQTASTGDLKCSALMHVVIPPYRQSGANHMLDTALDTLLHKSQTYSTIAISPFTCHPLNYPVEVYARSLLVALTRSNFGIYSDLNVSIFVDDIGCQQVFEEEMKEAGCIIHHVAQNNHYYNVHSISSTSVAEPVRGNADTLKKFIKIVRGSILDIDADVYVNSTNPDLDFTKGELSQKLKNTCGSALVNEAKEYIKASGKLKPGQVAVTNASNTKAGYLYHVALPIFDVQGKCQREFQETVRNILERAKDEGMKSIAIPCLGVANLGYPANLSASLLFKEVIEFHIRHPSVIDCMTIVVFKDKDYASYNAEYEKAIAQVAKITPSSPRSTSSSTPATLSPTSSLKVKLVKGDLSKETTDVIVNSTSIDMRPDTNQISKALHEAAGPDLAMICSNYVDQGVFLSDGTVVPSNASGTLRCNKIYHAHVPGKKKGVPCTNTEINLLKKVVYNCVAQAEQDRQSSISFPAFCLGIGNYEIRESGEPMFEALNQFAQAAPKHVKEVRIVIYDHTVYTKFYDFFCGYFSNVVKQADGAQVIIDGTGLQQQKQQPQHRPRLDTSTASISAPKKWSINFRIYGIQMETLQIVEKQVKSFISDTIFEDTIDLGDTTNLLDDSDIAEIHALAEQQGVEVNIQFQLDRIVIKGEEVAVQKVLLSIQKKVFTLTQCLNEYGLYQWSYSEDGQNQPYPDKVAKQLEAAFKRHQGCKKIRVDNAEITVSLTDMKEYSDANKMKTIHRSLKSELDYPKSWEDQPKDSKGNLKVVHYVPVPSHSPEYTTATKRLVATMQDAKHNIICVKRVQNPAEYTRYMSLKTTWDNLYGPGVVKERELFHGTGKGSVDPICSTGFNRSYAADANAAHYGRGVYFALNSSYSLQDKYSSVDKDTGYKHMLVCSVLVGRYTKGDKKMKAAPPLPDKPEMLYDTLVENEDDPKIFVAMKDSQAYPKYWITLKKCT